MLFPTVTRKFRHFPTKLVGHHEYRFRNASGQFKKFRRGSLLTLNIETKSVTTFLDWITYLAVSKPVRKPRRAPAKRPVGRPRKTAPIVRPPKIRASIPPKPIKAPPRARRGLWTSAVDVMEDLESRYPNISVDDRRKIDLRGYRYGGQGLYNLTFWPTTHIDRVRPVKSLYIFCVLKLPKYDGEKTADETEEAEGPDKSDRFILAGKHVGWHGTPKFLMEKLLNKHPESKIINGVKYERTNLEALSVILFRKVNQMAGIMEYVGVRLLYNSAPKYVRQNPKRR